MKTFLDRIVAYIGENAAECVQTHSFLTLPKDALVNLISSDFLALEEEDVWRAVLSWAKYQVHKAGHSRSLQTCAIAPRQINRFTP